MERSRRSIIELIGHRVPNLLYKWTAQDDVVSRFNDLIAGATSGMMLPSSTLQAISRPEAVLDKGPDEELDLRFSLNLPHS